jgi:decaprenyl-phosphate phosphoribosyltransferase
MIRDYVRIARLDHWFKNIFMLPGIALAYAFKPVHPPHLILRLAAIGIFSTCLVASANYVINEWLDREFDKHHPVKKQRPSVSADLRPAIVYTEYFLLAAAGLVIAHSISNLFLALSIILLVMGLLYNVNPFRTKDKAYLDVLSESVNNPIRLILGWAILIPDILPPSSIWLAYWMGGAFIMAVKRYSEYRFINDPVRAGQYRKSFQTYTEQSLFLSSFFYANLSSFFLAVFLIKYRIEFILSFPFFALLFVWYLSIGMRPDSAAKDPEKIFRDPKFIGLAVFLSALVILLAFVDIPILHILVNKIELTPAAAR